MRNFIFSSIVLSATALTGYSQILPANSSLSTETTLSPMNEMLLGISQKFFTPTPIVDGIVTSAKVPFVLYSGIISDADINNVIARFKDSLHIKPDVSQYFYSDSDGRDFNFLQTQMGGTYIGPPSSFFSTPIEECPLNMYDAAGLDLSLAKADYTGYATFKGYPYSLVNNAGEFSQTIMLKAVPKGEVIVKGKFMLEYPASIESISFNQSDIGVTKKIGDLTATLLKIDGDDIYVRWSAFSNDKVQTAFLDGNNCKILSHSSISIGADLYDEVVKQKAETDSVKMRNIINSYTNIGDMNSPVVMKYSTYNTKTLVFYIPSIERKSKTFEVELKTTF